MHKEKCKEPDSEVDQHLQDCQRHEETGGAEPLTGGRRGQLHLILAEVLLSSPQVSLHRAGKVARPKEHHYCPSGWRQGMFDLDWDPKLKD